MKITKSRLKTIILEEMRKIDEQAPTPSWTQDYDAVGSAGEKEYNYDADIFQPISSEYGRSGGDFEMTPASATSLGDDPSMSRSFVNFDDNYARVGRAYGTPVGYGQGGMSGGSANYGMGYDIGDMDPGAASQAQLDAFDYAARSGGRPEQSTAQMFAGMDFSDLPEAGAGSQRFASADPAIQTPVADARAKAATAAATSDQDTFSGAGGYNYRELSDGSFYFTGPDGKPGYAPKGSGAAVAIANQRADMYGKQTRMAENRNALKNIIRMELKKSGII